MIIKGKVQEFHKKISGRIDEIKILIGKYKIKESKLTNNKDLEIILLNYGLNEYLILN